MCRNISSGHTWRNWPKLQKPWHDIKASTEWCKSSMDYQLNHCVVASFCVSGGTFWGQFSKLGSITFTQLCKWGSILTRNVRLFPRELRKWNCERGLTYMTSAKFSNFLPPPRLVTVTFTQPLLPLSAFSWPPPPIECGHHKWKPPKEIFTSPTEAENDGDSARRAKVQIKFRPFEHFMAPLLNSGFLKT